MIVLKNRFERMAAWATSRFPKARARWSFMAALAPVLLLQSSYFVRVLLTSEFFFALLFLTVLLVAGAAFSSAPSGQHG
jgi:hypothetical protein